MKGQKKLNIIIISLVITVIVSIFLYQLGSDIGTTRAAKAKLRNEVIQIKKINIELSKDNESLEKEITELDKKKQDMIDSDTQLKESTQTISEYSKKIEDLKAELNQLNTPGELNSKYSSQISKISNKKTGSTTTYVDTVLISNKDISPGRYCISVNGLFRIIKQTSNNVIESQNVGLLESDSYTTHIDSDCKIIIDGKLDFTPVN